MSARPLRYVRRFRSTRQCPLEWFQCNQYVKQPYSVSRKNWKNSIEIPWLLWLEFESIFCNTLLCGRFHSTKPIGDWWSMRDLYESTSKRPKFKFPQFPQFPQHCVGENAIVGENRSIHSHRLLNGMIQLNSSVFERFRGVFPARKIVKNLFHLLDALDRQALTANETESVDHIARNPTFGEERRFNQTFAVWSSKPQIDVELSSAKAGNSLLMLEIAAQKLLAFEIFNSVTPFH